MKEKIILLVEDNPDDMALTLRSFEKSEISSKVITAEDGEEALDYLFCKGKYKGKSLLNFPSLILLDLKLPKINGFEVLKAIRENESTKFLPVVILTTSKEEQDIKYCYNLGANSYIRKAVDSTKFIQTLQSLGLYWLKINETPKNF